MERTVQIGQYARPVFRRDILHRIDRDHRIELVTVAKVLQCEGLERRRHPARSRLLEHAARLIDTDHAVTCSRNDREVLSGSARRIQDHGPGR